MPLADATTARADAGSRACAVACASSCPVSTSAPSTSPRSTSTSAGAGFDCCRRKRQQSWRRDPARSSPTPPRVGDVTLHLFMRASSRVLVADRPIAGGRRAPVRHHAVDSEVSKRGAAPASPVVRRGFRRLAHDLRAAVLVACYRAAGREAISNAFELGHELAQIIKR